MFFTFEISKPIQKKPGIYRSDTTIFRIWWLWFAFGIHKHSLKKLLDLYASGEIGWGE